MIQFCQLPDALFAHGSCCRLVSFLFGMVIVRQDAPTPYDFQLERLSDIRALAALYRDDFHQL